jgi:ribosomal protein L37AE/L43A
MRTVEDWMTERKSFVSAESREAINKLKDKLGIKNKPKCEDCGSWQIYYRIKTEDFQCRVCGHSWKKEAKKKKIDLSKKLKQE